MATDRVGIEIELMGYDQAMSRMKSLDKMVRGLQGRKNYVKIQGEIDRIKMNRNALRQNKVKLKADMSEVDKAIKKTRAELKKLEAEMSRKKQMGALYDPKQYRELFRLRSELSKLNAQKVTLGDQFSKTTAEINQSTAAIQNLQASISNAGMASKSLGQIFKSVQSTVAHIGQAMQSAGNAITRLSSPMRSIMRYTLWAGGFALFGMAREGIASATKRYDIMKTYVPIMSAIGHKAEDAEGAIEKLNDAVIGIPTGLDEIVEQHKLLTMAIGDVNKATDLAIASNNAWVASGADESRVTMAKKELQTLAQTGKLNERQWMTLQKGMAVSWGQIQERMQKTGQIEGSLLEALKDGTVSAEEFMDALTWEGLHGKTKDVRDEIAHTFQSVTSNIQNAFSRMGYNVLQTLDEILMKATGKDVIDTLIGLKDGIDKMSEGVQNWIKANPDIILNFLDAIKNFDWKGFGKGVGDGLKMMADFATKAIGFISKHAELVGKLMTIGPLLGSALTIIGGLIKGFRFPIALSIVGGIGLGRLLLGGGIFTKIGGLLKGIIGLKGVATAAEGAGSVVAGKVVNLKGHFKLLAKGLSGIVAVGLGILSIGGTVLLTVKMIKSIVKDLGKISDDIDEIDPDAMKKMFEWIAIIGGSIATLGTIVGGTKIGFGVAAQIEAGILAVGAIVTTISGIAWINSKLIAGTIKNFLNATESVLDIVDNINALSGAKVNTDGIDNAVEAIKTVSSALDLTTDDGLGGKKAVTPRSVKKLKKVYDNLSGIIADIKQVATDLSSLGKLNLTDAETKATDIVNTLKSIYDTLSGSFDVVSKNDIRGTGRGETIVSNLAKIISDIKGTLGDFTALADTELDFTKAQESAEKIANNMQRLYDTINGAFAPQEQPQETGRNKTRQMGNLGYKGITRGQVGTAGRMKKMIDDISSTISTLKSVMGDLTGEGGLATLDTGSLDTAISNTQSIIRGLNRVSTSLGNVQASKDLANKAENLKTAVKEIKKVANTLNKLGDGSLADGSSAFTAISNIKTMVQQLGEALQTDTLTDIQEKANEFKSAVDDIFNALSTDLSNVELEVKIKGKVTGDKELIRKINRSKREIQNAVNGIKTNYSKTITISIFAKVVTHGLNAVGSTVRYVANQVMAHADGDAHGGYILPSGKAIYRAKGGGMGIFKPKGTDTVPAMLTPGEYVQNKRAVDFFGVEFMRRVNNLDIVGAMRELSAKAGSVVSNAKQTVINNNITNNNSPTINQNIQTNNPNFAFKRANRFVTAL